MQRRVAPEGRSTPASDTATPQGELPRGRPGTDPGDAFGCLVAIPVHDRHVVPTAPVPAPLATAVGRQVYVDSPSSSCTFRIRLATGFPGFRPRLTEVTWPWRAGCRQQGDVPRRRNRVCAASQPLIGVLRLGASPEWSIRVLQFSPCSQDAYAQVRQHHWRSGGAAGQ